MPKVIITAAVTGAVHTPTMSPYLPITPQQIADECVRSYEAGAAVAHIHVRDPKTGEPRRDLGEETISIYHEVFSKVKSRCDMIICPTTGGSFTMPNSERVKTVGIFCPEMATLNFGSINQDAHDMINRRIGDYDPAKGFKYEWEKPYLEATEKWVFANPFTSLKEFCRAFEASNTMPEIEIYDTGMIANVAYMLKNGYLKRPLHMQFVFGALGGLPPSLSTLMFLINFAKDQIGEFTWSVCAGGRWQLIVCNAALLLGGNARVGMEDNLFLDKGVLAKSNAEQVEKVVSIAKILGIDPATPAEARQMLGLKGLDKVNW